MTMAMALLRSGLPTTLALTSVVSSFILLAFLDTATSNKYTSDFNKLPTNAAEDLDSSLSFEKDKTVDYKSKKNPFRISKMNLLWSKAQKTLSDAKLKSLYSDLKLQDKEELTWKKVKAEGGDKEGLREAELRRKLKGIIHMYSLEMYYDDNPSSDDSWVGKESRSGKSQDNSHRNKSLFKDKKLNKLWQKAIESNFDDEELIVLKEEFRHHQDKVDEYYNLLEEVNSRKSDLDSVLDNDIELTNAIKKDGASLNSLNDLTDSIRHKHRDIKENFDKLHRMASLGPNGKDFVEPKVQGLWKAALESDFSTEELESLKVELQHYEQRLLKLRHLHAELAIVDERNGKDALPEKSEGRKMMNERVKKQERKVEKLAENLENRIRQRHTEL